MKQALGIAEMRTEVHLNLFECALGEMEGEVRVEVQVAYLDSISEVGDVRDASDVLPKVGGEFRPWNSRPNKNKMNAGFRQTQRILPDGCRWVGRHHSKGMRQLVVELRFV